MPFWKQQAFWQVIVGTKQACLITLTKAEFHLVVPVSEFYIHASCHNKIPTVNFGVHVSRNTLGQVRTFTVKRVLLFFILANFNHQVKGTEAPLPSFEYNIQYVL